MRRSVLALFVLTACGGDPLPPVATTAPAPSAVVTIPAATSAAPANDEPPLSPNARAFRECREGRTDGLADAMKDVLAATQRGPLEDRALVDAIWDCFAAFRPSKAKSINLVKDLQAIVLKVKDPSYGAKAVTLLKRPVTNPTDPAESMDEIQWWQSTSVRLSGDLAYGPAVPALVGILSDPKKRDLLFMVRIALLKMPKEAEAPLADALGHAHDAKEMAAFGECLASIGRPEGKRAVLAALAKAPDDEGRAVLALYIPWFGVDASSLKAYRDAYAKVDPNVSLAMLAGGNARAALLHAASSFFDPSLVEWIVREVAQAKGDAADAAPATGLPSAIRLMTEANASVVEAATKKIPGQAIEKDMWKAANVELTACKKDVACHLKWLDKPVPASPIAGRMGHLKAAWMAGVYGQAKTADALADKLAVVTDASVRLAMVQAIDHLLPNGDGEIAKKLETFAEKERADGRLAGVDEIYRVALRLRARAL